MKKYLALLLSMLLLVGCARIEPEQGGTKPEPGQPDDVSAKLLSQYALAEVKLPELPAEPSEEELWTAYEKLDYDKMGEEAYHKAQEELWDEDDFDARSRAYSDAVRRCRAGRGQDHDARAARLQHQDGLKLLGGEGGGERGLLAREPLPCPLHAHRDGGRRDACPAPRPARRGG